MSFPLRDIVIVLSEKVEVAPENTGSTIWIVGVPENSMDEGRGKTIVPSVGIGLTRFPCKEREAIAFIWGGLLETVIY